MQSLTHVIFVVTPVRHIPIRLYTLVNDIIHCTTCQSLMHDKISDVRDTLTQNAPHRSHACNAK